MKEVKIVLCVLAAIIVVSVMAFVYMNHGKGSGRTTLPGVETSRLPMLKYKGTSLRERI